MPGRGAALPGPVFYECIAAPAYATRAASASASDNVGWACVIRAMSSALPENSSVVTASAIRSDARAPKT